MSTWRIYYDDGSTFDEDDGPFDAAPVEGVVCIVRKDGERVEFHSGADFYWRFDEDGSIAATSDIGPLLRSLKYVKFGRFTSNTKHARIMSRAREDWKGR